MADERILQLPDNGMGLVVHYGGAKAHHVAIGPDFQAEVKIHAPPNPAIIQKEGIALLPQDRRFVGPGNLNLLLLRRVVVKAPEGRSAGIVPAAE